MRESGGARMTLNLDALPGFALYSGQVSYLCAMLLWWLLWHHNKAGC